MYSFTAWAPCDLVGLVAFLSAAHSPALLIYPWHMFGFPKRSPHVPHAESFGTSHLAALQAPRAQEPCDVGEAGGCRAHVFPPRLPAWHRSAGAPLQAGLTWLTDRAAAGWTSCWFIRESLVQTRALVWKWQVIFSHSLDVRPVHAKGTRNWNPTFVGWEDGEADRLNDENDGRCSAPLVRWLVVVFLVTHAFHWAWKGEEMTQGPWLPGGWQTGVGHL